MNILKPVLTEKRLPFVPEEFQITQYYVVGYMREGGNPDFLQFAVACYNNKGQWSSIEKKDIFACKKKHNKVVVWYEEVDIESLLPDDETTYRMGNAASNGQPIKTMFYQEGVIYTRNHILRQLKK